MEIIAAWQSTDGKKKKSTISDTYLPAVSDINAIRAIAIIASSLGDDRKCIK